MSCVVQKFGGTSVSTLERIKNVADIVLRSTAKYENVVVVVSAMAGVTNKFIRYVSDMKVFEGDPEYDSVVSSGELVTSGLMAIALKNIGIKARSYTSWQVPIITDNNHGCAMIQSIDPSNINRDLKKGIVPVVCGFQGISNENKITTLGRGGSDLTAVAIASAIKADLCEIYSDVDGVYTVDPNLYSDAKKIDSINYEEMLEMASQGANILQERSVDYARKNNVTVRVASSFIDTGGTIISSKAKSLSFCGIAVTHNLSQIIVAYKKEEDFLNLSCYLEKEFSRSEIFKNSDANKANIMIDRKENRKIINLLKRCDFIESVKQEVVRKHFSKISVVGSFVCKEIADDFTEELKRNKIESCGYTLKDYRLNFIIPSNQLLNSISVLHKYCGFEDGK